MNHLSRHEQPRGAGAGGARLPDAVPAGLPHVSARADGAVLEEGPGGEAHLRVPAGLFGGLLHCHGASVPAGGQPLSTAAFISCHFTGSPPGVARLHPFSLALSPSVSLSHPVFATIFLQKKKKKKAHRLTSLTSKLQHKTGSPDSILTIKSRDVFLEEGALRRPRS